MLHEVLVLGHKVAACSVSVVTVPASCLASGAACARLGLGLPLLDDLGESVCEDLPIQQLLQLWPCADVLGAVQLLQLPIAVLRTQGATLRIHLMSGVAPWQPPEGNAPVYLRVGHPLVEVLYACSGPSPAASHHALLGSAHLGCSEAVQGVCCRGRAWRPISRCVHGPP